MKLKTILFKDKILIAAILISAIWHVFWLSALKVVVVPKASRPVSFSNVSFLGPVLDKGVLKVSVFESHERTIPEKHYLAYIEKLPARIGAVDAEGYYKERRLDGWTYLIFGENGADMTVAAIDIRKLEPGRDDID